MPAVISLDLSQAQIHYNPYLTSGLFEFNYSEEGFILSEYMRDEKALKSYIRLERVLKTQFKQLLTYYNCIPFEELKNKFSLSCSALLELNPDILSLELTLEPSILYTVKKKSYTLFVQHFLNDSEEDEEEIIVSAYKNTNKLPSFAGSLNFCLMEINNIFEGNKLIVELPLNEVSI